jgi:hypothetical protein
MPHSLYGSEHIAFLVTDGAAVSKAVVRTKGARGLGTHTPSNREATDLFEDGKWVGALFADETSRDVTITCDADSNSKDVIDFILARGSVYGVGGSAPAKTVDPVGQVMTVELTVQVTPPTGTPWTRVYQYARASVDESGDSPAEYAITFSCFGTVTDS